MYKKIDVRQWLLAGFPPVYHHRNGPFPLNRLTERGASIKGGETEEKQTVVLNKMDLPAIVERLSVLLKRYPTWIVNTDKHTAVRYT